MFTVAGAALIIFSCGAFWYLLPRHGEVHPLVRNSDIGSMVTIGLMTTLTAGVGLLAAGIVG